jgi:hypothetical protein
MNKKEEDWSQGEDWWAVTSLHEAAHGIIALVLGCVPIKLSLFRDSKNPRDGGSCLAYYPRTHWGKVSHVFVANAPFVCHEYLPTGDRKDLHERHLAYNLFKRLISSSDEFLFRSLIDEPLLSFFSDSTVQESIHFLAKELYKKKCIVIKYDKKMVEALGISPRVINKLFVEVDGIVKAIGGE